MSSTDETPDPRFLAGETAVLTDASEMALVIAIGWDGAADITANIAKEVAAKHLRYIADQWVPPLAQLGLATTRELLTEIKARGDVSHTIGEYPEEMGGMAIGAANLLDTLPGSMLDYRTVDS